MLRRALIKLLLCYALMIVIVISAKYIQNRQDMNRVTKHAKQ